MHGKPLCFTRVLSFLSNAVLGCRWTELKRTLPLIQKWANSPTSMHQQPENQNFQSSKVQNLGNPSPKKWDLKLPISSGFATTSPLKRQRLRNETSCRQMETEFLNCEVFTVHMQNLVNFGQQTTEIIDFSPILCNFRMARKAGHLPHVDNLSRFHTTGKDRSVTDN